MRPKKPLAPVARDLAAEPPNRFDALTDDLLALVLDQACLEADAMWDVAEVCRRWRAVHTELVPVRLQLKRRRATAANERVAAGLRAWAAPRRLQVLVLNDPESGRGSPPDPEPLHLGFLAGLARLTELRITTWREAAWGSLPPLPALAYVAWMQLSPRATHHWGPAPEWTFQAAGSLAGLPALEHLVLIGGARAPPLLPWLSRLTGLSSLCTGVEQARGRGSPVAALRALPRLILYGQGAAERELCADLCIPPGVTQLELLNGFSISVSLLNRARGVRELKLSRVDVVLDVEPRAGCLLHTATNLVVLEVHSIDLVSMLRLCSRLSSLVALRANVVHLLGSEVADFEALAAFFKGALVGIPRLEQLHLEVPVWQKELYVDHLRARSRLAVLPSGAAVHARLAAVHDSLPDQLSYLSYALEHELEEAPAAEDEAPAVEEEAPPAAEEEPPAVEEP